MISAQLAMKRMMLYDIGTFAIQIIIMLSSFLGKKSHKTFWFGIGTCITLIISIVLFVPFAEDYAQNNIVVQEGFYENVMGDKGNSYSDVIGIGSVVLQTKDQIITLTTAPGNKDIFVSGRHYVKAYYLPKSKILLHIEMLEKNGNELGDSPVVPTDES